MERHVLVVDDDKECSHAISIFLTEAGFSVSTAASVVEAEECLRKKVPDILFLDIYLGNDNGLDFLPKFKASHPQVPVVVFTGAGYDNSIIKEAVQLGATMYFSKDFSMTDLIPLIQKLLGEEDLSKKRAGVDPKNPA